MLCIVPIGIAACQDDHEKYYAVVKAVPIYREPIDGTADVVYEAKKGEICTFGKEITKKVYMFREVTCGDAHGWTPDWSAFEEVSRATAKNKN